MKKKILYISVFGFLAGLSLVLIPSGRTTSAQTNAPLDDNEPTMSTSLWFQGSIQKTELIGRELITGDIHYLELDSNGIINISRDATVIEIENYNAYVQQLNIQNALNNLSSDPEAGVNYQQWVSNRTAELIMCETNLNAGSALGNWTTLSNGQQNAVIAALLQCGEESAKLNRKLINNLLDLLIAEGIIE